MVEGGLGCVSTSVVVSQTTTENGVKNFCEQKGVKKTYSSGGCFGMRKEGIQF